MRFHTVKLPNLQNAPVLHVKFPGHILTTYRFLPVAQASRRSFKADILALDITRTPILAYISQLEWLATTYGEDMVLQNIVPTEYRSENSVSPRD